MFGDERRRQINLGGATSTVSQASVLAQVQQERQRRHNEKRAHEASSVIQVRWRAHAAGSKTRSEMLRCFDNEPIGTIPSTRFLVLGGGEHQRLVAWTNAALNAGEGAIFQPFSGREAESWLVLLRQLTSMMLTQAIHSPLSPESNSFLQFIDLLVAPRPNATPSTVSVAQATLQYLLKRNLYSSISLCIQNIPIESKSAPILGHLISLAVAPFRVFSQTSPSYSDALTQVCNRLMVIPLFPNRIGIAALTQFSSQVPFGAFHLVSVHDATHQLSNISTLHLLANLLTFLPPRYATANAAALGGKALETYIELLSNLVSQLPIGSMERSKSKHKEPKSWASDDDTDEDVMPESRLEKPSPPALSPPDNKTALKLATLVSQAHVSSLLRVANKNAASWKQFVRLMINVSAKWPSKRDSILTTMAVSGGNVVFKQLWRDSVRSSSLGKTADPLLMKRTGSAEEWPPFLLLAELYNQALLTMGDDEFFATNTPSSKAVAARNPFSTGEVILFSRQLLNVVFPLYWNEDPESVKSSFVPGLPVSWEAVRDRITKCLQAIHARDSRRPFTPPGHWLMTSQMDVGSFIDAVIAEEQKLDEDNDHRRQFTKRELAYLSPRLGILNNIPFAIPFESRVSIFRSFVRNDQQRMSDSFFRSDMYRKKVIIRRDHVSQDGFDHLNEIGAAWKGRLAITFVDQFGQEEAGIDGGGVFKEFLTSLSREVFDTNRGLWLATKQQELYPNSHSYAKEPHQLNWYRFIGRVLGKALYEGILVDVTFAGFFLAKWLGKQSFLDDLASLDADLYQGLLYLKNYTGNPEELSLDFTITEEDFGVTHTVNLKPNGGNIPVTRENRLEYIYLVSHYRLTRQIKKQTDAFFEGLSEIIDPKWLRMFNQQELKVLVGGAEEPIDLDDLRDNVVYGGLYDENHAVIRMFWRVVKSLDQEKRRQLLRFVTSCARPPLLGFKELYPKFAIRDAGIDTSRLPTASTCVNLLKLPLYQDEETMRRKLLHAITSGAGFDLS